MNVNKNKFDKNFNTIDWSAKKKKREIIPILKLDTGKCYMSVIKDKICFAVWKSGIFISSSDDEKLIKYDYVGTAVKAHKSFSPLSEVNISDCSTREDRRKYYRAIIFFYKEILAEI